jgi:hypothetical protein
VTAPKDSEEPRCPNCGDLQSVCLERGQTVSEEPTPAKPEKSNPMRVACDRHNEFRPVYVTGRPLLDDRCPWCRIEELEKRK